MSALQQIAVLTISVSQPGAGYSSSSSTATYSVPGMWAAADGIYYTGGRTRVDGVLKNDLQQNVRAGLTFALPIQHAQSLKFQYARGAITRVGGDFSTIAVSYQFRFVTRK